MTCQCVFCHREISFENRIGRTEECPHCRRDIHCCLQCRFYDRTAHHECRESSAEFVADKEKANFCDYFVCDPKINLGPDKSEETKQKLEKLFGKK